MRIINHAVSIAVVKYDYHDISFHVETVALMIQGEYVSNEVKAQKSLRAIVLKSCV